MKFLARLRRLAAPDSLASHTRPATHAPRTLPTTSPSTDSRSSPRSLPTLLIKTRTRAPHREFAEHVSHIDVFPKHAHLMLDFLLGELSKRTKSRLRADKRKWRSDRCEEVSHHWANPRVAFAIVRQLAGKQRKLLGNALRLTSEDCQVTSDRSAVTSAWHSHWQKHFAAVPMPHRRSKF
eukprot:4609935-Amphidinium_carterae.1